jgi:uncharacterized membrane protein
MHSDESSQRDYKGESQTIIVEAKFRTLRRLLGLCFALQIISLVLTALDGNIASWTMILRTIALVANFMVLLNMPKK